MFFPGIQTLLGRITRRIMRMPLRDDCTREVRVLYEGRYNEEIMKISKRMDGWMYECMDGSTILDGQGRVSSVFNFVMS